MRGDETMRPVKIAMFLAGVAGLAALPLASTRAPETEPMALDFSDVTSEAKARKLVKQGVLVRVRLFPERYGGPDEPENIGYLPPHVLEAKEYIEDQLGELAETKGHNKLRIELEHVGQSIVPVRMVYMCYGQSPGMGDMAFILEIW